MNAPYKPAMAGSAGTAVHNAVEVSGLSKIFGTRSPNRPKGAVAAVDDVSFSVLPGQLMVLLGPSGCGKTTLLRCVAGLERPTAGRIDIGNRQIYDGARDLFVEPENRELGMMFQSYALWPHMTVQQNVAYALGSQPGLTKEQSRERVESLFVTLGVAGLGARYPSELSGGQQQRVALARALVRRPSMLLFDEPLSNVDARVRRKLRAELRALKVSTGFAGIYVTHDQEEAMELADILAVMENGKIIQMGSTREIYDQPVSMYVADFIGEINRFEARIVRVDARTAVAASDLGEIGFDIGNRQVAVGDAGWLVIRPEDMKLGYGDPNSQAVRLGAVVNEVVFLGARIELRLRLGSRDLHIYISDRDAAVPSVGDTVSLDIARRSLKWLTR